MAFRMTGLSIASRRFGVPSGGQLRIGRLAMLPPPAVPHGGEAIGEIRQDGPHVVGRQRPARPAAVRRIFFRSCSRVKTPPRTSASSSAAATTTSDLIVSRLRTGRERRGGRTPIRRSRGQRRHGHDSSSPAPWGEKAQISATVAVRRCSASLQVPAKPRCRPVANLCPDDYAQRSARWR